MSMRGNLAWTIGAFLGLSACTLLLNRESQQCATNADCAPLGQGLTCVANLCTGSGSNDGAAADGGTDAAVGFDGCFAGTPSTSLELLNACTAAQCAPSTARSSVCATAVRLLLPPRPRMQGRPRRRMRAPPPQA